MCQIFHHIERHNSKKNGSSHCARHPGDFLNASASFWHVAQLQLAFAGVKPKMQQSIGGGRGQGRQQHPGNDAVQRMCAHDDAVEGPGWGNNSVVDIEGQAVDGVGAV